MKRKELLKLHKLEATPAMMKLAAEDVPHEIHIHEWGYDHLATTCKYELFLRSQVEQGILKVALFYPEHLRAGGRKPAYTIFFDRKSRRFITFQHELQKWSDSKLDRLDWRKKHYRNATQWISTKDSTIVQNYLGIKDGSYASIKAYQMDIRKDELNARHRKETDPWDADLAQTPALPKNWDKWIAKVGIPEHFIFYQYTRKGATSGYCTYCEKEVPIRNPRHNKEGRCPCCRHKITLKSIGKAGRVFTKRYFLYLLQPCHDGMIVRLFTAERGYPAGNYFHPFQNVSEIRRTICSQEGKPLRAYYWGDYKHAAFRWISCKIAYQHTYNYYYNYYNYDGLVYGYTMPYLTKTILHRTGFTEYWLQKKKVDPEWYLVRLQQLPQLELIVKAGLLQLADECMENLYDFQKQICNDTSLMKSLGINAQGLKRLRRNNGGMAFHKWLQYEKATCKPIPDQEIQWLCKEKIGPEQVKFITDRMTIPQICHYIRRNMQREQMSCNEVLITWADYLSMANAFHYDVMDEIVYRPTKLRLRHNELVLRSKEKDIAIQAGEVLQKFPHVDEICQSLHEKFSYTGEKYMIVAPENVMAIIKEGNTLHHCIANSDRYWDRMETHESYLLFLRKTEEPAQAYYTLEVEPNGTVRQIRTYYDRQNAEDIDAARAFLQEWQRVVAKRLTEADRGKAQRSRNLREQEFVQMRNDQVTICTGDLAGQLLVDVLTADLMENQAA